MGGAPIARSSASAASSACSIPGGLLGHPHLGEPGAQLLELPAAGELARELAEHDDRGHLANRLAVGDGRECRVEHEPLAGLVLAERDQVGAPRRRARRASTAVTLPVAGRGLRGLLQVVDESHQLRLLAVHSSRGQDGPREDDVRAARSDLRPLRVTALLRAGSALAALPRLADRGRAGRPRPRCRDRHRSGRARASSGRRAAPSSASTRAPRCSPRRRAEPAARSSSSRRAPQSLPFDDGEFDGLTFTYLLRYVDDPPAVLRELARVVRPGGTIAGLEFGLPTGAVARPLGAARPRRPARGGRGDRQRLARGRARSSARRSAATTRRGRSTGSSRPGATSGIGGVSARRLSLGGGVVTWGRKR